MLDRGDVVRVMDTPLDARGNEDIGMCRVCCVTGYCARCSGEGRYMAVDGEAWVDCSACGRTGTCVDCGGTGREPLEAVVDCVARAVLVLLTTVGS